VVAFDKVGHPAECDASDAPRHLCCGEQDEADLDTRHDLQALLRQEERPSDRWESRAQEFCKCDAGPEHDGQQRRQRPRQNRAHHVLHIEVVIDARDGLCIVYIRYSRLDV
jgi:hypothetical protein